jgi:uncharacterized Zn finger protein
MPKRVTLDTVIAQRDKAYVLEYQCGECGYVNSDIVKEPSGNKVVECFGCDHPMILEWKDEVKNA